MNQHKSIKKGNAYMMLQDMLNNYAQYSLVSNMNFITSMLLNKNIY